MTDCTAPDPSSTGLPRVGHRGCSYRACKPDLRVGLGEGWHLGVSGRVNSVCARAYWHLQVRPVSEPAAMGKEEHPVVTSDCWALCLWPELLQLRGC